ncbi:MULTISPECIES: hypothetical protein [unclassified Coleofasciculus]|uniref:hypothetical protein n=1 Tax=unclassified Coleofasciculus TaxID=2692782 RepID=UPI001882BB88|nr:MULTISPECIES: hypothetical protein [unclassified Coleofasciculus]MBE9125284.1 hypothetical protein [Coleofasciculus sp. LEGE 07081]MBE9147065.1 hypothetical protein [Coleofasciculus sp. LEGE 07092]
MNHQLTAIATTGALVTSFMFAPISAVMAKPTSNSLPNTFLLAKSEGKLLKNVPFSLSESGYTIVGKA